MSRISLSRVLKNKSNLLNVKVNQVTNKYKKHENSPSLRLSNLKSISNTTQNQIMEIGK
jgi:hypothetical protein